MVRLLVGKVLEGARNGNMEPAAVNMTQITTRLLVKNDSPYNV